MFNNIKKLNKEASKYNSPDEFIDSLPSGGKEGRDIGKGFGTQPNERGNIGNYNRQ